MHSLPLHIDSCSPPPSPINVLQTRDISASNSPSSVDSTEFEQLFVVSNSDSLCDNSSSSSSDDNDSESHSHSDGSSDASLQEGKKIRSTTPGNSLDECKSNISLGGKNVPSKSSVAENNVVDNRMDVESIPSYSSWLSSFSSEEM